MAPELLTEEGHLVAALLAAGEGAILSHGTAAWRWRIIPAPPSMMQLAVPRAAHGPAGVTLHEAAACAPATSPSTAASPPPPSPARSSTSPPATTSRALLRALAEAEFHHDLRPADIKRTLRRGHPGSANLRAALDAHVPGHGETKSQLERRFRRLLIRHGIELPLRNDSVGPWTVDCLWPEHRVVVELDGGQHERPHQADADLDRDLWLRATATSCGATATARSTNDPTTSSPTCSTALGYAAAGVPLRLL